MQLGEFRQGRGQIDLGIILPCPHADFGTSWAGRQAFHNLIIKGQQLAALIYQDSPGLSQLNSSAVAAMDKFAAARHLKTLELKRNGSLGSPNACGRTRETSLIRDQDQCAQQLEI
uniref:hypothetical protein n=1 Tax=Methylovirgula sp. 4M-Z18 TaxID=2293567 RepID=UPI0026C83468